MNRVGVIGGGAWGTALAQVCARAGREGILWAREPEVVEGVKNPPGGDPADDPMVAAGDKIFSPEAEIFYVSGQVNSPGSYALRPGMTVAQAIAKSGGVTESGNAKSVRTVRDGKKVKLKEADLVQAGDVLTIGERMF